MNEENNTVTVNIDNKSFELKKGLTILQAAEQNNIYIPTLCAHKDLTPYGGCRMCLVEVEGARGFLTACTTPLVEGMVIRTHTDHIQKERREILELVLSEHTSSCLICDEKEECKKSMTTIRKVGVTTGCRYCSNDDKCELEEVVSRLQLNEINHPIYYRNLRVEKEDPFYDRDYNLCILCGRCVRICQEVRNANVLAFNQRGRHTVIGPAFDRTHTEAGCEFCGACVSVCPTGALAEKSNKWNGVHEREQITTCALCGVGCQMRVLIKGDKVVGTVPAEDDLINNEQLCVKGRFCVNELVNNYQRLRKPTKFQDGAKLKIEWDQAIEIAAAKLSNCPPEKFGMIVSPNCSNEDLYIAQKFTRAVMGSNNINNSARLFYGAAFNAYLNLMKKSTPLSGISKSSVILTVGLDMKYERSVVGVLLRKAIECGARIVTIHPHAHSLSLSADVWLQPKVGAEADTLHSLVELTENGKPVNQNDESGAVAQMLKNASNPVILVGSLFLQYSNGSKVLESIEQLAQNIGAGVLPLPAKNNLYGSLMMGTYQELLPGGAATAENGSVNVFEDKLKVVYLIGEDPQNFKQSSEFIIYQNIYPPNNSTDVDLTLPAAAFTEIDGTFINGDGRIQRVRKAVDPQGDALPDWKILCLIANKMGKQGFDYADVSEIHKEIADRVDGFVEFENLSRKPSPLPDAVKLQQQPSAQPVEIKAGKDFPFLLTFSVAENIYRGIPLSSMVEGLKKLVPEESLLISQQDAEDAGISQGDEVVVTSAQFEKSFPAQVSGNQEAGTLSVILHQTLPVKPNPHYVKIRRKNV